ncbi:MAG TPA: TonB-dependent receptor plug domain-containing protein, partial [Pyrinomonadaceae bacterium]|nr:TonB-dependent receptor plug domain-containing protein [Pyrinomonadaceae bacterium]
MKRLLLYFSMILVLLLSTHGQVVSQHTIRGSVRDINGAAIVGARATLRGRSARERVTVTDDEGRFSFDRLPSAEYDLQISAAGFSDAEETVNVGTGDVVKDLVLSVGGSRFAVTAEIGQSEDVNKIPQAVNIIGPVEIQQRATSVLAQIAGEEVGLNIQRTSPTVGAIVVRGLTGKNVSNYVDGVRYTNGAQRGGINTFFNLNDASNLQAVEVLRGPNGAQYGSDSLGGTVNLLTRSPVFGDKAEFHGELSPSFNSADRSFGSSGFFSYGTDRLGGYVSVGARRI